MSDYKIPFLPAPVFVPPPKVDDSNKKDSTKAQDNRSKDFKYGPDGKLIARVTEDRANPAVVRDTDLEEQQNALSEQLGTDSLTTGAHPQLVKADARENKQKMTFAQKALANARKGGAFTKFGKGAKVPAPKQNAQAKQVKQPLTYGAKQGVQFVAQDHHADVGQFDGDVRDPNINFKRYDANVDGQQKKNPKTGLRTPAEMKRAQVNIGGVLGKDVPNPDPVLLRQLSAQGNAAKRPTFQQRALENPAFAMFQKSRGDKGSSGAVGAKSGGSGGPSLVASAGGAAPRGNQNPISGLAASLRGGLGKLNQDQVQAPASNLVAIDSSPTFKANQAIAMDSNNMWGGGMAPSVSMANDSVATALNGAVLGLPSAVSQKKIA